MFQIYLKTAGQAWLLWPPHLPLTQSYSLGQVALFSFLPCCLLVSAQNKFQFRLPSLNLLCHLSVIFGDVPAQFPAGLVLCRCSLLSFPYWNRPSREPGNCCHFIHSCLSQGVLKKPCSGLCIPSTGET